MKKVAIVLFNLGGPLNNKDVRPFLYNLFSDKHIIGLPAGLRQIVAGLISSRREKSAQANYQLMGGGSPILAQTKAQAQAIEAYAAKTIKDVELKCFIAMRYWHPMTPEVMADITGFNPDEIILLPLYPQFSKTTTYSSMEQFKKLYKGKAVVKTVCCYPQNDYFIKAHVDLIKEKLKTIKDISHYSLLFSAHGLPESVIKSGDPYQSQIEATVSAIMAELNIEIEHIICYQSRVGPLAWIGPSTDETIKSQARLGKNLIIVPIAFVSEHIETLVELDIDYGHMARDLGVADYQRIAALGTSIAYIKALTDEILKALGKDETIVSDYSCAACHTYCPKRNG